MCSYKVLEAVAAFLQKVVVQVREYMGPWQIRGRARSQVVPIICIIQCTFNTLGLLINSDKSVLSPVQKVEFIGEVLALPPQARLLTM